ncbi:hypothetical protein Ancab_007519 [Ancistrocladus abbreviatus]
MASYSTSASTKGGGAATKISSIHSNILQTYILPRLDGLSLASLSCTSSYFRSISTVETLWRDICISTWPSTNHPIIQNLLATFPGGHRRIFSDSFPLLSPNHDPNVHKRPFFTPSPEIISAVDVRHQDQLIFSKVQETKTAVWRRLENRPFWVDLLDPKENLLTPIQISSQTELEEHLTLSWIVIDPTRKRAANISSLRPVRVYRHWSTGDIRVKYATTMGGLSLESPLVECKIVVTCSQEEGGGKVHVRRVCMKVEDMDEKRLNGRDCLEILANAKRDRRERKVRSEKRMKMAWLAGVIGLSILASVYCSFSNHKRPNY